MTARYMMMMMRVALVTFIAADAAFAQSAPSSGAPAAPPAGAPAAPALGPPRTAGEVLAIDGSGMTLKGNDGMEWRLVFAPSVKVLVIRQIEHSEVKAQMGAVASSKSLADGKYEVVALRVSPPDFPNPNQGRRTDEKAGTTNVIGTVAKVTKTSAGHEMDFDYPGGTLHAVMPPDVLAFTTDVADRSLLKVGATISAQFVRLSDGTLQVPAVLVWKRAP